MAYRIVFTAEAKKDVERLDAAIKKRLQKKLLQVASSEDVKPLLKHLTDHAAGEYRLRIGDYRVICDLERKTLYILRIRHRREVYR